MAALDRFLTRLEQLGVVLDVREMDSSTHTAADAAAAVGVTVGQIVKSLLFMADGEPLLVLVSGPNRVDTAALGKRLGTAVTMADAKRVRELSGFSIGGVPPFGHLTQLRTVVDPDLLGYDEVWAAAGSATTVFGIAPSRLLELTRGEVLPVGTVSGAERVSAD
jgi:prolyl-tRNA editing enzyme YbaK/EbsC (Cys-tRNA(Pro) deacylase)